MNVEENLAAVLRERADREVDADALLAGALAAGRARPGAAASARWRWPAPAWPA